jgi:hypothetical protein
MKLHLLTKDTNLDYPRVGWLPELPGQAHALWDQFGGLHAAEYPEIVLRQTGGVWQLYLSAIDSGRKDYTGTRIRVSFYLAGATGEAGCSRVANLLALYAGDVLCGKGSDSALSALLKEQILPGQPASWPKLDLPQKEAVAAEVLKALSALPACSSWEAFRRGRWHGGCDLTPSRDEFIAFCQALLNGKLQGMAFSLANLSASDIQQAWKCCGDASLNAAVLLTTPDERALPLQVLSGSVVTQEPKVADPSGPVRENPKVLTPVQTDLVFPPPIAPVSEVSKAQPVEPTPVKRNGRVLVCGALLVMAGLALLLLKACTADRKPAASGKVPKAGAHEVKR